MQSIRGLRLFGRVQAGPAVFQIWCRRAKTRRGLRQLDARELCDIGLSESERQRECDKWFWQA
jgi:uncharacterized protein YjiS (DUF1127 family)